MQRKFFLSLIAALFSFTAPLSARVETVLEIYTVPLPDRGDESWKLATDDSHPLGATVREWIPANQTLKGWNEMITAQYVGVNLFVNPPENAEEYLEIFEANLKKRWPGVIWHYVKGSQDDLLIEWALPQGYDHIEHELMRVVWTENGIHRIAYTRKGSYIQESDACDWFKRLERAKLGIYNQG